MLPPHESLCHAAATYEMSVSFFEVVFAPRVNKFTPVKMTLAKRCDKDFRRGYISSKGHVVNVAKSKQVSLPLINLNFGVCASEIKHKVDFVKGNTGCDLVCSA